MNEAYLMDCMEYMKTLPDNAFDLAVVDPPYGDGCSQTVHAEREREARWNRFGGWFDRYKNPTGGWHGKDKYHVGQVEHGQKSTGKKLLRGMLPQRKNTLTNSFASHTIKSFGAGTISTYHPQGAF